MPFNGSHPAAVLPFLRTPLPASALVAGSLAPDLPYHLPVRPGFRTHTALAVVTVDLLLGALLWALWHGLLAAPALDATPAAGAPSTSRCCAIRGRACPRTGGPRRAAGCSGS